MILTCVFNFYFQYFRLRLVRVKVFPENRYFQEMLFSGKENVFMCLVSFQKMFQKIFSDVWLCSWKYHKKHIFYLLLTFSQLPNEYIISFIPKNTNKTQKRSHFLSEIAIAIEIGAISISEITIAIEPISIARSQLRSTLRVRSARSRSRSTSISTVPMITIAL